MSLGYTDLPAGRLAGIAAMLAATITFTGMDAVVKLLLAGHSLPQVLFFRALFGLVPLLPLLMRGGWGLAATGRPWAHVLRSGAALAAVSCFFSAVHRLPLAQVTVIGFGAPLIITALSVPLLKEHVTLRRWAAVSLGFVGVALAAGQELRPAEAEAAGVAFALAGTLLYALVVVLMRALGRTEPAVTTVFWFSIITMGLTGPTLPWTWSPPDAAGWALLAAAGILGGSAQLLMSQALRLAPASTVAPFDYFHILASAALGRWLFGEIPTPATLAGAVVVVAAGLYVVQCERRGV